MKIEDIIAAQRDERNECLKTILASKSNKKIIVAGPGTGKTYTFKEILKANPTGKSIAMTFINKLTKDMETSLGDLVEVKTFHAYCKKILHQQNGKVELVPFLTMLIEKDADVLGLNLSDFDTKFRILDQDSPEIAFYLKRGNYYDAVSFDDSVYRLYKVLIKNPNIVPLFNQILIDEYQDFNPLEVAFIDELEKRGKILIVGDDDQSVYEGRRASPNYLRNKYNSGEYERYQLPFCGRCPEVIVNSVNELLGKAESNRYLQGRISKRYECFLENKENDNTRYPKIVVSQCTTGKVIAKLVDKIIQNIVAEDIEESWEQGSEYTTVLVVGQKQYLNIVHKELADKYPQMAYKPSEPVSSSITDGYNLLLRDQSNNLGWRILLDYYPEQQDIKRIIKESQSGKRMLNILDSSFIKEQKRVIDIIRIIISGTDLTKELGKELKKLVSDYFTELVDSYTPKEKVEEIIPDKTKPSFLLSSFVGCKGLSAGHVIIVGANNGSIPKDPLNIKDVEISQFIVAMTRTRKQCHIVSNKWLVAPIIKEVVQKQNTKTCFLDWIPSEFIEDKGVMKSKDIK